MKHLATLAMLAFLATSTPAADDVKVWATATATRPSDGRRIVYRFIQAYRPTFDRAKYPVRVVVSWPYATPTGMPSVAEREAMDRFEDLLVPQVEKSSLASLAVVRTGDNVRQWIYYATSESVFRKKLDQARRAGPSLPLEVQAEPEPGWETYDHFVRGVRK